MARTAARLSAASMHHSLMAPLHRFVSASLITATAIALTSLAVEAGLIGVSVGSDAETASVLAVSNGGSATTTGVTEPCLVQTIPESCLPTTPGIAVSASGSATAQSGGLALSNAGCAAGTLTISVSGCSVGPVAASGTNSASGAEVAISGTGSASATTVAVSGTGSAYACGGAVTVAVSAASLFGGPDPQSCSWNLPVPVTVHEGVVSAG